MAINLIRNLASLRDGRPNGKRTVANLSDGYRVAVTYDVGAMYVYVAPNNGSWVLSQTITTDNTASSGYVYSICVDAANNLHIAWRSLNYDTRYEYLVYNAATHVYAAPTHRTLYTSSTWRPDSIDIDCPGDAGHNRYCVVAVHSSAYQSTGRTTLLQCHVINDTAGAVYTSNSAALTTTTASSVDYMRNDITVQCAKIGDPTSDATFAWTVVHTLAAGTNDLGDTIKTFTFNTSTHNFAITNTTALGTAGKGGSRRRYFAFCKEGDNNIYLVGAGGSNFEIAASWRINTAGVFAMVASPSVKSSSQTSYTAMQTQLGYWAMQTPNGKVSLGAATATTAWVVDIISYDIVGGTITWDEGKFNWEAQPSTAYKFGTMNSGSARYQSGYPTALRWFTNSTGTAWRVDSVRLVPTSAPTTTKPSAASVQTTSFPVLEGKFNLPDDIAKVRYKFGWELSQDPAFASGVISVIQPDSTFQYPKNTTPTGKADVRASMTCNQRLAQGTWYVRSYQIDQFGNSGTRSASVSFTVSHPPSHSNESPNTDSVLVYGTGDVTFIWSFSSPSPGDSQTAYEIDIIRTSDGASVASSGVVASTSQAGTVNIPSGFKDTELSWALTVYDNDNVPSAAVGGQTFFVSDPPVPAITAPANGSTITSGQPAISWTSGVMGVKTEAGWRIQVTQGVQTLYDSGWVPTADTSFTLPPGILHNLQQYTMRLYVVDSLGQQGFTSIQFNTNYVVPAGVPALAVFLYEFERKGFIQVGWEYTSYDTDFYSWNVYRQAVGEASGTLLAQYTDLRPAYGFRDLSAKANTTYTYWVTQTVNRFGDYVESLVAATKRITTPSSHYWLLDSISAVDPVPLYIVTGDSYQDEHEEAVVNIIGRGRHVDIGQRLGLTGTLTCQARDRQNGLSIGNNYSPNPSLQYAADGQNPDGWAFGGVGSAAAWSAAYDTYYEPAPHGKYSVYSVTIDSLVASPLGSNYLTCVPPDMDCSQMVGQQVRCSQWLAIPPSNAGGLYVYFGYYWLDATKTLISSGGETSVVSDTYEPAGAGDAGGGNWKRYAGTNLTVPAGAKYLRFFFNIGSTTDGSYTVYFGGTQISDGGGLIPMFDGDTPGCTWTASPGSASYSPGVYSARDQASDIVTMKELERSLYLRNPFGDLVLVSIGDDSGDRIAGVAKSDFKDITIPYREVAF